ncbi:MAG: molybdenum cofactor biosynthesis protein MoaE [Microcella sp.]|uniref:molybdenum cofactor biosynthesis protein MoaE n=1 Tax=Microcella sp. TaxID=1913979 RepID=UPI003315768B
MTEGPARKQAGTAAAVGEHGGSAEDAVHGFVTDEPLDAAALESWVASSADGAVVTFRGVVRDHDHGATVRGLDYRAHPEAESMLRAACVRLHERTGLRVAAAHRVGSLTVGDVALVAVVASPHRAEAFAAVDALVVEIKASVPIWKRQHLTDGSTEWVGL